MGRHKTEKRVLEYLIENLPGEIWKKERGDFNTQNKTYYTSNKGRRKVVFFTTRKNLFDEEKKCYYNLIQKWEKLSNNRRKESRIIDPYYHNYRLYSPFLLLFATEEELQWIKRHPESVYGFDD